MMEGAFRYSMVLQQVGGGLAAGIVSGTAPEMRAACQAKNPRRVYGLAGGPLVRDCLGASLAGGVSTDVRLDILGQEGLGSLT